MWSESVGRCQSTALMELPAVDSADVARTATTTTNSTSSRCVDVISAATTYIYRPTTACNSRLHDRRPSARLALSVSPPHDEAVRAESVVYDRRRVTSRVTWTPRSKTARAQRQLVNSAGTCPSGQLAARGGVVVADLT